MKLKLQTMGFTASKELTTLLYQKLTRLARFFDKIIFTEVKMAVENSGEKENKICTIRLAIPGNDLRAYSTGKTFEEAIADAASALKKQIEKRKTNLLLQKNQRQ